MTQISRLPKGTIDEIGHRYGRLVVLAYSPEEGKANWRCRCDCGGETIVRGTKLRAGLQVSCGCRRADSDVRQAARLKTSARLRRQIAAMGGNAIAGKPRRHGP